MVLTLTLGFGCTKSSSNEPSSLSAAAKSAAKSSPAQTPQTKTTKTMSQSKTTISNVNLEWAMTRGNKSIAVTYAIENKSDQRIYVCDKLLSMIQNTTTWRAFPALSLQNMTGKPDTAQIVVGTPPTDVPSLVVDPVTYIPLDPGQSMSEKHELPLPLESYNPMGMAAPLNKSINKAVLIVQSFRGEPPSWRELPGENGMVIRIPDEFTPMDLVGNALPIP